MVYGDAPLYRRRVSDWTLLTSQALVPKQLAAMLGAVSLEDDQMLLVAAYMAKNIVEGNRSAQEFRLNNGDVRVEMDADGKVVAISTEVRCIVVWYVERGERCKIWRGYANLHSEATVTTCTGGPHKG